MRIILSFIIYMLASVFAFAQYSKMSPYAKLVARESASFVAGAKGKDAPQTSCLTAFVRTSDKDVLVKHGCKVLAQWDDIYIASIPLTEVNALALEKQVARIEAGESCMLTNDTCSLITNAQKVWYNRANKTGYTGKGVVVGIMDVGFDLTHPTFRSATDGECRIKRLWDMLDYTDGGEPVTGERITEDAYFVGRQYIGNDAILKKKHSADGLIENHGTHTAGSVAGCGEYSGMAPEADICLVANAVGSNQSIIPKGELYKYSTATDMLGFKYIFDYAESVGKPCVISFSEGSHDDLYQSGLYGEVLGKLLGPGKILCASAGNERNANETYLHKPKGKSVGGAFLVKSNKNTGIYVLRSEKPVKMSLSFYKNNAKAMQWDYDCTQLANYPDSVMADTLEVGNDKFVVLLNTYPSCFDESLYATDLFVIDMNNNNLGITNPVSLEVMGEDNDIEGFCSGGYFKTNNLNASLKDIDHTHNVLFPGSSEHAICIGATSHRRGITNATGSYIKNGYGATGGLARFSGCGPSIAGNIKPDVVAPGTMIVSALNSFWREKNTYAMSTEIKRFDYNGRTYGWYYNDGTSMATPIAAGIVALWLQARPTLTPDEVKDILAHSSKRNAEYMEWPNNDFGYGEIDAEAGLKYLHQNYFDASDVNKDGVTNIDDVSAVISIICGE